jgi:hypothetical protein
MPNRYEGLCRTICLVFKIQMADGVTLGVFSLTELQIARAILPYFDWIDHNSIESLGSCLKDFGIHIEIDEIHGSTTQVVPRRLTFIKEVPDLCVMKCPSLLLEAMF